MAENEKIKPLSERRLLVEIDNRSGFCFGVVNAITKAEENISDGTAVVSLGDIVHNDAEVARLAAMGLETVPENENLENLVGRTVLIRAHGEPPQTYIRAQQNGIRLADATCPVVAKLQLTVVRAYSEMRKIGGQVVIFGKRGHAEVRGLAGQVGDDVTIVENTDDLEAVDFNRPIYLLSQTTRSLSEFEKLGREIRHRAFDPQNVTIHDTICRQVSDREEHLAGFARRFDVVIFVAGGKSSNGQVLFEAVKAANTDSHKVEDAAELCSKWFEGKTSVGICGATSTPRWLMERVADAVNEY